MKSEELINTTKSSFLDKNLTNPVILVRELEARVGKIVKINPGKAHYI